MGVDGAPERANIVLHHEGEKVVKTVPTSRLIAAGAAREGAKIRYQIFEGGPISISRVDLVGPTEQELLREIQEFRLPGIMGMEE